jgi:hypothetical protein
MPLFSTLPRIALLTMVVAAAALFAGAPAKANNLIVDGDFSAPNQGGGWSIYIPGTNSWSNINGDGIEIGSSPIYGLPCISSGCQNLEVNANTFDTDSQLVSGLAVGQKYTLSWDYGGRTSGGPDSLGVSFGGSLLVTDSGSIGAWMSNSYTITATATQEILEFASNDLGGLPSYGNEITNVVLSATPLPSTWTMLLMGLAGLGFVGYRQRKTGALSAAA